MAGNLKLDPSTGDYVVVNGAIVETDSLTIPAYFRLAVKRTQWLYAPDTNYGSDFYLQRKRHRPSDSQTLESVAINALQPLIDDGRASSVTATVTVKGRNYAGMEIDILDAQGEPQTLKLDSIGD